MEGLFGPWSWRDGEIKKKNGMAMQAVMGSAQARQPKKTPRPSSMQ